MLYAVFKNIGCRLNQSETEALAHFFLKAGFGVCAQPDNSAHVIIVFVNTCTVTTKAEQKCRHVIRSSLKSFPNAIIIVSGCYAQLESKRIESIDERVVTFPGMQKGFLKYFPDFLQKSLKIKESTYDTTNISDTILLPEKSDIRQIVYAFIQTLPSAKQMTENEKNPLSVLTGQPVFTPLVKTHLLGQHRQNPSVANVKEKPQYAFELSTSDFVFRSRATIKVQDGCNSSCSFCRIHKARGSSVSLEIKKVVQRAQEIEKAGKNEIVLTGVNVSQYRDGSAHFSDLLKQLLLQTTHIHFRISSFYPEAIDQEFVEVFADKRVCPYIHLSVQSGSERILKYMRRPSSVQHIEVVCDTLKKVKPDTFIGADIIAGFPSETEEDFQKTLELCTRVQFQHIHAFPFSARPDTEAFYFKPRVPEKTIAERVALLNALSEKNYKSYMALIIGKTFFGIVENFSDGLKVLTENYVLLPLKQEKNTDKLKSGDGVFVKVCDSYCILA